MKIFPLINTVACEGKSIPQPIQMVMLEEKEISALLEVAKSQKEKNKHVPGQYGNGILNGKHSGCRTEYIGLLGEYAFSLVSGEKLISKSCEGGDDGQDFLLNKYKIDIKTKDCTRNKSNLNKYYFQLCKKYKRTRPEPTLIEPSESHLKSHAYVFCSLIEESSTAALVRIDGWVGRTDLISGFRDRVAPPLTKVKNEIDQWFNIYIQPLELRPLHLLFKSTK